MTTFGILARLTLIAFLALLIFPLIPPAPAPAPEEENSEGGIVYCEKGAEESAVRLTSSLAFSSAALACWSVPGIKPRMRSALAASARGCSGSCLFFVDLDWVGLDSKSVLE